MIDIEQRALRAFEEDALALAFVAVEQMPDGIDIGRDLGAMAMSCSSKRVAATSGWPMPAPQGVVMDERAIDLRGERASGCTDRPRGWPGGRPCLHRPGRCRVWSCRSCPRPRPPRGSRPARWCSGRIRVVFSAMRRLSRVIETPSFEIAVISASSAQGSITTPLPITRELAADDARRQQAKACRSAVDDERVSGIVAALVAHDDIGALGEPVDDLAFAFIAPLGADHNHVCHFNPRMLRSEQH